MKTIFKIFCILCFFRLHAQDSTKTIRPFTFSGYVETYYSYDFNAPENHLKPGFFYSYNRHNEVNLNIRMVKAVYQKDGIRANFGLMAGTYPEYNLSSEPEILRHIYEANVGVKVSKSANLWVDAGILPSHIGFESAIGKDCANLTRSMLADNSPYYEAGVKLGYTSQSGNWYFAAMYLNGWQRIQRVDGNQTPAFGSQITFKPSDKATLNWSTYVGNEQPDSIEKRRYFNNCYGTFNLQKKFNLTAGFDIGFQQKAKASSDYCCWFSPVIIAQYLATGKIRIAARAEYYQDKSGVIIASQNGFKTTGFSANFDYLVSDRVLFRVEARNLSATHPVFEDGNSFSKNNFALTTSLSISF